MAVPEFVVVAFPARRNVFMDNQPMGHTGDRLTIQAGFHDFDLGLPADYTPATQNLNVVNTTAPNPMIVSFAPAMAVVGAVAPKGPMSRAKRKATARKTKAAKKTSRNKTAKAVKKTVPKKRAAEKAVKKKAAGKK